MKLTVYFCQSDKETNDRIRERFSMPMNGMTVNGEQVADIKDEDLSLLQEVEKLGFIQIRNK